MKFGIIVFPGSNCDRDCYYAVSSVYGISPEKVAYLWHKDRDLLGCDCIILPGGFSYGDYLRAGAIASRSPIMSSVIEHAKKGGLVLGICNGFQMLTETGLLPGALMRNNGLKFICRDIHVRVEEGRPPYTSGYRHGDVIRMPIAHMDGCYYASADVIKRLNDSGRVMFRYCDAEGKIVSDSNPNGSIDNIAGIVSEEGNVLGMMPHPERASDGLLTGTDGKKLFESIKTFLER